MMVPASQPAPWGPAEAAAVAASATPRAALATGGRAAVTPEEMYRAVEALYAAKVTPRLPVLQWYLSRSRGGALPSASELRAILANTSGVYCEEPLSGRTGGALPFIAYLKTDPPSFAGFQDEVCLDETEQCSIASEAWEAAGTLLLLGGWPVKVEEGAKQNEKYEIAVWLQERSAILATYSLGQVIVMVQRFSRCAETTMILGKRKDRLVPFPLSDDFERLDCARQHLPYRLRPGEVAVTSWKQFRDCLECLLYQFAGSVSSSRLKLLFRENFHLELCETVFGYTNVSSMLQDEALSDLIEISIASSGQWITYRSAATLEPKAVETPDAAPREWPRIGEQYGHGELRKAEAAAADTILATQPSIEPNAAKELQGPCAGAVGKDAAATSTPLRGRTKRNAQAADQLVRRASESLEAVSGGRKPSPTSSSVEEPSAKAANCVARLFEVPRPQAPQLRGGRAARRVLAAAPTGRTGDARGRLLEPFKLPDWCTVRRTFIEARPASSAESPPSTRGSSSPPSSRSRCS